MLSGYDLVVRGFWQPGLGPTCRACAAKKVGESAIARLEAGLTNAISDERSGEAWERLSRYELDERATENGYEYGRDCTEPDHSPVDRHGERYCEDCAVESCWECGVRLDTTPEEESAHAA